MLDSGRERNAIGRTILEQWQQARSIRTGTGLAVFWPVVPLFILIGRRRTAKKLCRIANLDLRPATGDLAAVLPDSYGLL